MESTARKVEKRNRPPVSCEPCRTRKLRCNRDLPCESCIKRNKTSLCRYAPNASRVVNPGTSKQRDLKDRLNALESLVSSFLSGDANIQTRGRSSSHADASHYDTAAYHSPTPVHEPTPPDTSPSTDEKEENSLTPEMPHLQETEDGQVNYIDPSHWLSILEDIKEVREHLDASNQPRQQSDPGSGSNGPLADASFLFGSVPNTHFREILSSLPPQPVCDKLVSWYFYAHTFVSGIVHPAKFQTEYEAFWESPSTASPVWAALLFSILSVMVSINNMSNRTDPDSPIPPVHVLQQRVVQCLVLGRYATANAYALEAFMLHLLSFVLCNSYAYNDAWFEMGVSSEIASTIIRLAFRMGYHRDPKHLAGISVFEGEMRRRVWLNLVQIEALMSYQLGFPSMIPSEFCDTEVPRNLEYSDLQIDMTTLPPGRPLSEQTTVRYTVAKHEVMAVFKRIVAHTQSLATPSQDTYTKTMALHNEMLAAYDGLPEALKRRDVNRSFLDSSSLIMQRSTIETLYLKALIILHRRYISYDLQSQKYEASRRICVESALDILGRQADLYKACQPGGRLYEERWMVKCLPVPDFLLAAMVICLDLSVCMRGGGTRTRTIFTTPVNGNNHISSVDGESKSMNLDFQQLKAREYRALQTSREIWAANSTSLPEAHLASLALDLMIRKVAEDKSGILPSVNHNTAHVHGSGDRNRNPNTTPMGMEMRMGNFDAEFQYAGAMSQMIDGSENVDWALLDQYLQHLDGTEADALF